MSEAAEKDAARMRECLEAILKFKPNEVVYDEFAYKRMVGSYRDAARAGLGIKRKSRKAS